MGGRRGGERCIGGKYYSVAMTLRAICEGALGSVEWLPACGRCRGGREYISQEETQCDCFSVRSSEITMYYSYQ